MGYSAVYLPDHFSDQLGPIAALMGAADATTSLRIGSLVFDNDYRHPAVLAKEAATLDLLSDGRLDFGLGAGWLKADYEQAGIALDPPAVRIARMAEAVAIFRGLFTGEPYSYKGTYYEINQLQSTPVPVQKPHPPFLIGGGGRRMLELAAREADIVNVNYNLREGRINRQLARTGLADATEQKLEWIKEAAGARLDEIELSITIFVAKVTDDRESAAEVFARGLGVEADDVLKIPHFLIGSIDELADDLVERRERYGVSYVIVPGEVADALAPLVERLTGR